jgi:heme exporter protein C
MGDSHITGDMIWPLLVMTLATHIWFFASVAARSRVGLLEIEGGKEWARDVALGDASRETVAAHG